MEQRRRLIADGDSYTVEDEDTIEIAGVFKYADPPVEVQGEPWGWTKGPPFPKGFREDGVYGTE